MTNVVAPSRIFLRQQGKPAFNRGRLSLIIKMSVNGDDRSASFLNINLIEIGFVCVGRNLADKSSIS